jgi:hypothetical protein
MIRDAEGSDEGSESDGGPEERWMWGVETKGGNAERSKM